MRRSAAWLLAPMTLAGCGLTMDAGPVEATRPGMDAGAGTLDATTPVDAPQGPDATSDDAARPADATGDDAAGNDAARPPDAALDARAADGCVASDEVCNNRDDNCNGLIDEAFDLHTDVNHCGDCATACASASHATPLCVGGACRISCIPGWGDCDGDTTDGCETDLTTREDCGSCGIHCGPGQDCRGGSCMTPLSRCTPSTLGRCTSLFPGGGCRVMCGDVIITCSAGTCTCSNGLSAPAGTLYASVCDMCRAAAETMVCGP